MSDLSMVMLFKCLNYCKVVSGHLRLSFNAANAVLMCRIGVKYKYNTRAVCAYACVFREGPGSALIGACVLIRTNMVCILIFYQKHVKKIKFADEVLFRDVEVRFSYISLLLCHARQKKWAAIISCVMT